MDLLRCALGGRPGGFNRAHTLEALTRGRPPRFALAEVSKSAVLRRSRGCGWVQRRGNRVHCLVIARQRSGPLSWEITHLFLQPTGYDHLPVLLEGISKSASLAGGQRVFLRLRRDDPLVDIAGRGGFFHCTSESLYKAPFRGSAYEMRGGPENSSATLRKKRADDQFGLFRLYSSVAPSEVRFLLGMTFDQWSASRERRAGRCHELVLEQDGALRAWLRSTRRGGTGGVEAMVHPDMEATLAPAVEAALKTLRGASAIYCLVPEHQDVFKRVLRDRGFESEGEYVTLVNSMAVVAREKEEAPITAAMPTA